MYVGTCVIGLGFTHHVLISSLSLLPLLPLSSPTMRVVSLLLAALSLVAAHSTHHAAHRIPTHRPLLGDVPVPYTECASNGEYAVDSVTSTSWPPVLGKYTQPTHARNTTTHTQATYNHKKQHQGNTTHTTPTHTSITHPTSNNTAKERTEAPHAARHMQHNHHTHIHFDSDMPCELCRVASCALCPVLYLCYCVVCCLCVVSCGACVLLMCAGGPTLNLTQTVNLKNPIGADDTTEWKLVTVTQTPHSTHTHTHDTIT